MVGASCARAERIEENNVAVRISFFIRIFLKIYRLIAAQVVINKDDKQYRTLNS